MNDYGRVEYLSGNRVMMIVPCPDREVYELMIEEGSKWVEAESGDVSIRGIVYQKEGDRAA